MSSPLKTSALWALAAVCAFATAAPAQAQVFESGRSGSVLLLDAPASDNPVTDTTTALTSDAPGARVETPHVRAELIAHAPQGIQAGGRFQLGLLLEHAPHWHTYWLNPGDSGMATELQWQLPAGFAPGAIAWPAPQKLRLEELANYGYEGQVLLPVSVDVPQDWGGEGARDLDVRLHATWLACKLECIPEEGQFHLRLPADIATTGWAERFAQAERQRPVPLQVQGQASAQGEMLQLRVQGLPADWHGQSLEVFAEQEQVLRHGARAGSEWQQRWQQGEWQAELPLSPDRGDSAQSHADKNLPLVLTRLSSGEGGQWDPLGSEAQAATTPIAWRIELPIATGWSAADRVQPAPALTEALAQMQAPTATETQSQAPATPAVSVADPLSTPPANLATTAAPNIALLLLLALLGGAVLNLMPCVFPVLAIKALSLARHSHDRRVQRQSAWAYGAGVVLSCTALGALVLALQAAGRQLGWGFQLQSPWFVALMALLFTLIGLALAGVFQLGIWMPERLRNAGGGGAGDGKAHSPVAESFFSGVLAVLVASPCTGPFLGAALGATLTLPALAALAIFAALGVGLALPFMLLVWVPRLLDRLPRPGAWMETFRNALAFPMFATVVWLLWVLAHQIGANAMIAWLFVLWGIGFALWLWGKRPAPAAAGALKAFWAVVLALPIAVALAGGHFMGKSIAVQAREAAAQDGLAHAASTSANATANANASETWQTWSLQAQQDSLAQGQPVFVDFTASWCITCQYNKATTLADAEVLADFARARVRLLRADWTRPSPAITQALHSLGRTGVPTYALHVPGQGVQVMSEILDKTDLRERLAALAR